MQATLPQTFIYKTGKFPSGATREHFYLCWAAVLRTADLSARLNTQGFDQAHIGQIFAGYGIVVAITSRLSGVCVDFLVLR